MPKHPAFGQLWGWAWASLTTRWNPILLVSEKESWFGSAVRIPSAKTAQAAQKQRRRTQTQNRAAAEPSEGGGGGGGGTLQFILVLHRAGLYRISCSGGRFFSGGSGSGEGGFGCGGGGVSVEDGGEGDAENPEDSGEEGG